MVKVGPGKLMAFHMDWGLVGRLSLFQRRGLLLVHARPTHVRRSHLETAVPGVEHQIGRRLLGDLGHRWRGCIRALDGVLVFVSP